VGESELDVRSCRPVAVPDGRNAGQSDRLWLGTGERGPHGIAVDAEGLGEVGHRHDDAAPEADALEVAASDELVGRGAADAKDLARLLDSEGEGMVMAHT